MVRGITHRGELACAFTRALADVLADEGWGVICASGAECLSGTANAGTGLERLLFYARSGVRVRCPRKLLTGEEADFEMFAYERKRNVVLRELPVRQQMTAMRLVFIVKTVMLGLALMISPVPCVCALHPA